MSQAPATLAMVAGLSALGGFLLGCGLCCCGISHWFQWNCPKLMAGRRRKKKRKKTETETEDPASLEEGGEDETIP